MTAFSTREAMITIRLIIVVDHTMNGWRKMKKVGVERLCWLTKWIFKVPTRCASTSFSRRTCAVNELERTFVDVELEIVINLDVNFLKNE